MKSEWERFNECTNPMLLDESRDAFYAGAICLFNLNNDGVNLQGLKDECTKYAERRITETMLDAFNKKEN